jgi:hypothetical protein
MGVLVIFALIDLIKFKKDEKNNWDIGLVYFLLFAAASIFFGATVQVIYEFLTRK